MYIFTAYHSDTTICHLNICTAAIMSFNSVPEFLVLFYKIQSLKQQTFPVIQRNCEHYNTTLGT